MERVDLHQCMWGGLTPKPTSLLVGHLLRVGVTFKSRGCGGFCNRPPGTRPPLRGRDSQGGWLTAPAKVYPPDMCKAMALTLAADAYDRWPQLWGVVGWEDAEQMDLYAPLDPYLGSTWGHDCFRSSHVR